MKVWGYDIWEGDKGIIFAETKEEAKAIYKQNYNEPIYDGDYEPDTCQIDYVCDVPEKPSLVFMYN